MASQSLLKKYLMILMAIASITFLSVFLIQRNFQMLMESPSVVGTRGVTDEAVRLASVFRPDSLDPAAADDPLEAAVCALLYDTLYERTDDACVPSKLVQHETLEEGVLTLDLNPEAMFHGGRRVGAEDVKFSVERAASGESKTTMLHEPSLFMLQGYEAFAAGRSESIAGVEILDDNSIRFLFEGDADQLKRALCASRHAILERRTVERTLRYGQYWRGKIDPVINGTGPYRLAEWDGDRLVLERAAESSFHRFEFVFHDRTESVFHDLKLERLDGALWDAPGAQEGSDILDATLGALPIEPYEELVLAWKEAPAPVAEVLERGIRRHSLMRRIGWDETVRFDARGELLASENPESAKQLWRERAGEAQSLRLGLSEDAVSVLAARDIRERMEEIGVFVELILYDDAASLAKGHAENETDALLLRRFIRSETDAGGTTVPGLEHAVLVRNRYYLSLSEPLDHPAVQALQGRDGTP